MCLNLRLWWTLTLLFLIANPSRFGLQITNLAKVKPNCTSSKWVRFRFASIFLKSCPEAADERVEAAPGLSERARAGGWWVRVTIKWADWGVHLGLAKLVKVAKEFEDMGTTAPGKRERRPVVLEILAKGVPVPALLVLIAAGSGG